MNKLFQNIPKNWKLSKIGNYTTKVEYGISKSMNSENIGVPILRMNNLDGEGFTDYSDLKYVDIPENLINKYSLDKNDILFNRVNSVELVGKTSIIQKVIKDMVFASYLIRVNVNKMKLIPEYLNYYLNSRLGKLEINRYLRRASSQANINAKELRHMKIIVPTLAEQYKITYILSNIDKIIKKTSKLIKGLQVFKKGLMQRLFTKGIWHTEFKETRLGKIPKEWEIRNLEEIGAFQYGYTTSAISNDTGIKFLRITDIKKNGFFNWDDIPFAEIDSDNLYKFILKEGDIVIARIGATTGKTCYIDNLKGDMIFASYLIRFKINKTVIPKFVFYYSQTQFYDKFIYIFKEGKLKKGINAQELKKFKIPIPKVEEQKKIVEILTKIDLKIKNEKNCKNKLKEIKKGLMQDLLTGKKRVKLN